MLKDEFRCLTKMHSVSVTDLNAQAKTTKILQREHKISKFRVRQRDIRYKTKGKQHKYACVYI